MKLTGWALFISKIEIVACMIFGVHSLKTGKHKKLAAIWLVFEVLTNVATVIYSMVMLRINEGSWSKGFKKASDSLDKEFGIIEDNSEELDKAYTRAENLEASLDHETKKASRYYQLYNARDMLLRKYALKNKSLSNEFDKLKEREVREGLYK